MCERANWLGISVLCGGLNRPLPPAGFRTFSRNMRSLEGKIERERGGEREYMVSNQDEKSKKETDHSERY
jgi:hypothetical protein